MSFMGQSEFTRERDAKARLVEVCAIARPSSAQGPFIFGGVGRYILPYVKYFQGRYKAYVMGSLF
jgi:hypothetical protein